MMPYIQPKRRIISIRIRLFMFINHFLYVVKHLFCKKSPHFELVNGRGTSGCSAASPKTLHKECTRNAQAVRKKCGQKMRPENGFDISRCG